MNIVLWVLQGLLAVAFILAGSMKVSRSNAELAKNMAWVNSFSQAAVRRIGGLEILGALGLVLPALTGVLPWLTPLAAAGLALTMIGAMLTHIRRGELPQMAPSAVLFVLAAFAAYGRFVISPF